MPLPISDEPIVIGPASLPPIQVLGAVVAIVFFLAFNWFFKKSRMGVAMRAVADNQQVAQAMGINVERYFAIAWAMAGIVSALGGIVWGSMLGVDVQLALVGLKVFPVVILGGLDSIGGALVGGLDASLAAGYLDPYVGGGTKDFAPYVLMTWSSWSAPASRPAPDRARVAMFHANRVFKTTTAPTWRSTTADRRNGSGAGGAVRRDHPAHRPRVLPLVLNLIFIAIVGALGLASGGLTGQISIGHGAFMSVGAYTAANLR